MSLSHIKFTYQDFLLFPEDGKRHELIDGDHYVTPAPKTKHQKVSGKIFGELYVYLQEHSVGFLFAAPTDVVLSDLDIVEPDLLFIAACRSTIITDANVQGAPDLVVEILSERSRKTDEIIKRKLYERYGVKEYWIVDLELDTVKIYRMTETGYVRSAELSREANDSLTSSLLPGFHCPLMTIFS